MRVARLGHLGVKPGRAARLVELVELDAWQGQDVRDGNAAGKVYGLATALAAEDAQQLQQVMAQLAGQLSFGE